MTLRPLLTLASALALSAGLAATAQARPMEIEDLAHIQTAGNLSVAPDGQTIAFTVSKYPDLHAGETDGGAVSQLFVQRPGEAATQFTSGSASVSRPQFSPDGQTLYFQTRRGDDTTNALYALPLGGGEARKVFQFDTNMGDFAVAPDAKTAFFVATPKSDEADHSDKGFNAYAFEEDSQMSALFTVDLGAAEPEAELVFDGKNVSSIDLSPDGRSIIVAAAPTNLVDDALMKTRLHVFDARSGKLRAEFETPGKLGGYAVSPDNRRIAFLAGTDINDTATGVLMLGDLRSGEFEQLTADAPQHIMDIEWMDDGSILAVAHRGVESELVVYGLDGSEKRTLSTPDDIVVRNAEVGAGGTVFFTADSPRHPTEVYVREGRRTGKITELNDDWLSGIDLARQSTFTYEARDGREIEGLLITPEGRKPRGGWPLILTVHGGPEAHYSDGWMTAYSLPGQFGAGDGYAVFYPNYRGSTGRGVAFAKEHQDDYAGAEFNDLVDAVDALVEDGLVDEDRVGITGGSYGGYASMWGATAQSDTFAASVAFVGISNQISKFGTSDIPNEMRLVHSLKWPWEDNWQNLLERSPIYHAGKSTTPTLILHGEKDTRVHPSQSMELYRAMKVRTDTPVRLVFYPDEGHGNRKAASRLDYAYRLMRWMDTYLGEDASRDDPKPPFDIDIEAKLGLDDDSGSDAQ